MGEESGRRREKAMSNLGEDIETLILLRLPVKSLLRFKCVCKRWSSLISAPQFAKTHLRIAASSPRILLATDPPQSVNCESLRDDDRADHEGMPPTQLQSPIEAPGRCMADIVGYCNGLVCFEYVARQIIVLWNPATRESRNIPYAIYRGHRAIICGLGYDPSTDDYKILRYCHITDAYGFLEYNVFDVFALKTGSWRRVHDRRDDLKHCLKVGTYANGFLHLLVWGLDPWEYKIVSFSMSREKFEDALLPLPESDEGTGFGVLGGECLVIDESKVKVYGLTAQMGSEYVLGPSSSWKNLCYFSLQNQTLITCFYMRPFDSTGAGKIAFSSIGATCLSKILRNVITKRFVKEAKFPFTVYVESLVSPHGAKVQDQYSSGVKEPVEKSDFTGNYSTCKEGKTSYKKANSRLISKRRKGIAKSRAPE